MFGLSSPEIFTLVSTVFLLSLGIIVLYKNRKNIINILFFLVSLVFSIWMFGTFMMFIKIDEIDKVIFWDRFVYLGVVFMPAFQYHLSLKFTESNKARKILLWVAYSLSFIFLLFSRTNYFVDGAFRYEWGAHTLAQPLHHIFLGVFFFYIFALLYNFIIGYLKSGDREEKNRIIFLVISFSILNLLGGMGYLPAYEIIIYPFFLLSPIIFSVLMMMAIARYQLLNVQLITAQLFSLAIVALAFVDLFLSNDTGEFILKIFFFVAIFALAIFFSKSVAREAKRKEELQKMSDELARKNDELRKLDNAKSEFISIASHQLRTPLTAIKGFISLLLEGSYGELKKEHADVLNKIYLSNERLIRLVEDLLNISRIESGRIEYKYDKVDLRKICEEVIDTFTIRAKDKGLYLDCQKPEKELAVIYTDGEKVREVVSNLIDNAIKYTPKGGVTAKTYRKGDFLRIEVSDTGIGIPEGELQYLFNKFSRGKDTNRLNTSGTGLGLYVGRSMIESLGGKIWAESEGEGMGSKFVIELPAKSRNVA